MSCQQSFSYLKYFIIIELYYYRLKAISNWIKKEMLDNYPSSIFCPVSSFGSRELEFSDEKCFLEKFSTGSTQTWKETHELLSALSSC